MSIANQLGLITKETPIIIQGITGRQGSYHAQRMLDFGGNIVAGVTPGKQGQEVCGLPVYDTVEQALEKHQAEWSCLFVPPRFVKSASTEALQAGLNLVIITEHVPVHDVVDIVRLAQDKGLVVVGPNCPGLVKPEQTKIGIMPGDIFLAGEVGVVSRSGTLMYVVVSSLSATGIGQSLVVGVGGDPVTGLDFISVLQFFQNDPATKEIVLIGEIGGDSEERAAEYIKNNLTKPVSAFIAGKHAPVGETMGHAGALITKSSGSAIAKEQALASAGVRIIKELKELSER